MNPTDVGALAVRARASVRARARALLALSLGLILSMTLAACGGGGTTPVTSVPLRALSDDFNQRKAVAYSPFRTALNVDGLAAEVIPRANIEQDMNLLVAAGFGLIRTFDSSDKVSRQTLEVIRDLGLDIKMQLGIYVQTGDEAFSQQEIARGVALANEFPDIVLAVSVGNETMVSWSFNRIDPDTMGRYITQVRNQIAQPVTTNDNYAFWASAPNVITDAVDFAALHTYPGLDTIFDPGLWDWRQLAVPPEQRAVAMMDAAIAEARRQYQVARNFLDRKGLRNLPIVIGETGWNAVDVHPLGQPFRAHPVNQKMYYDRLQAWVAEGRAGNGPKAIFYFEAFDEPWKQGDDKWGLFNVERQARYVIQALNPPSATWVWEPGDYTDDDAVFYMPPTVNPAVTEDRYTIYSDAPLGASELRPAGLRWDPFDGDTVFAPEVTTDAAPGDGSASIEITPRPRDYGWGFLNQSTATPPTTANLSGFAGGSVNFSVRTAYPGRIEIGISSDSEDGAVHEAYLQIGPGDYGYCNTGVWCAVSIPVSAFVAANPALDLSLVLSRFIIADRYSFTGKPLNSNITDTIGLDAVYWAR